MIFGNQTEKEKEERMQFAEKLHIPMEMPSKYRCAITDRIMFDPVTIDQTNHTFERKVILQWFQHCVDKKHTFIDPVTREKLTEIVKYRNGNNKFPKITDNVNLKHEIKQFQRDINTKLLYYENLMQQHRQRHKMKQNSKYSQNKNDHPARKNVSINYHDNMDVLFSKHSQRMEHLYQYIDSNDENEDSEDEHKDKININMEPSYHDSIAELQELMTEFSPEHENSNNCDSDDVFSDSRTRISQLLKTTKTDVEKLATERLLKQSNGKYLNDRNVAGDRDDDVKTVMMMVMVMVMNTKLRKTQVGMYNIKHQMIKKMIVV